MSFIRTRKIDWNKFFATMVACDPYGLCYVDPALLDTRQTAASSVSQARA